MDAVVTDASLTISFGYAAMCVGVAFLLSAAIIAAILPQLRRHALAHPNARSGHRIPTPQGGGLGVVIAAVLVSLIVAMTTGAQSPAFNAVMAAAVLLAVTGALDDKWQLKPSTRMMLQATAMLLVFTQVPPHWHLLPAVPLWLERFVLVVGGIWFVNAVNFMDGLDWMTVAEIAPVTAAISLLGLLGHITPQFTYVALALLGAIVGFAPFNKPVAKLFLGDVGSLPIGLLTGALLYALAAQGHLAAALILPLYYLADATFTLIKRGLRGEKVWEAHRSHFYQRAADGGMSVPGIVSRVFTANLLLAVLAIASVIAPALAWPAFIASVAIVWILLSMFSRAAAKR